MPTEIHIFECSQGHRFAGLHKAMGHNQPCGRCGDDTKFKHIGTTTQGEGETLTQAQMRSYRMKFGKEKVN